MGHSRAGLTAQPLGPATRFPWVLLLLVPVMSDRQPCADNNSLSKFLAAPQGKQNDLTGWIWFMGCILLTPDLEHILTYTPGRKEVAKQNSYFYMTH